MLIGNHDSSFWINIRYEIKYNNTPHGHFTAWELIRLFDEGQITEDTEIRAFGSPDWNRLKDGKVYSNFNALRNFGGDLTQIIIIDLLYKIHERIKFFFIGIGILGLIYLIFGKIRFLN